MDSRGPCGLCKKNVTIDLPHWMNKEKKYCHKACLKKSQVLSCEKCEKKWLFLSEETNWMFHPLFWCRGVYDMGETNERIYCAECAKQYGGIIAVKSNSELYMYP